MNHHPAFDILSKHGIRPVTNSPDGTFNTNCRNPKCGKPNTNFVCYDDESVGWHCEACGDSRIVPLHRDNLRHGDTSPQTGGNGGGIPFMLTAAHKVELHALGYSDEQILHITPQEGLDIVAQKRKASASTLVEEDFPEDDDAPEDEGDEFEDGLDEGEGEGAREREQREREEREKREREKRGRAKPTIAEAARAYHERGWKPVPIDRKTKRASGKEWQKRAYDPKQFRGNAQNVGVQLGKVSGGLTDVDLDCMEAIALAPRFLPPTGAVFGRKSKPASHRLYVTDLCEAVVGAVIQFAEYVGGKSDAMLVELRVGGKRKRKGKDESNGGDENGDEYEYTGATSVFPPSIHASDETVTWERDGEPATVGGDELSGVVGKLAVASLLKGHYPGGGSRHKGALAIGGVLARAGWSADDIGHVVEEAARAVGDGEVDDRVTAAKGAVGANATGTDVAGLQSARETWGDIVADTLGHWLKVRKLRPDKGVGIEDRVALDFAAQQADDLRHIAEGNKWMHWDGGCWREEKTLAPYDIARKLCRAAGDARARTVAGSISLARSDRRLVATTEQWDTDAMLLQSTGMTIDLRTGTAFSPLRSNYMTKRTVCDLAPPGTPHPRWSAFLLVGTEADETLIAFLKRLSGYCLTGLTREHKFGFFHGPGGNGKGVYLNALKAVMGDYAIAAPMEMFLLSKFERHPTEIAQLKG